IGITTGKHHDVTHHGLLDRLAVVQEASRIEFTRSTHTSLTEDGIDKTSTPSRSGRVEIQTSSLAEELAQCLCLTGITLIKVQVRLSNAQRGPFGLGGLLHSSRPCISEVNPLAGLALGCTTTDETLQDGVRIT